MTAVIGASALALGFGCGDGAGSGTTLIVDVWSDLAIPGEMDEIQVKITGTAGVLNYPFALGGAQGQRALPVRVALVPGGDQTLMFEVEAVGQLKGRPVVAQAARVSFVPRSARHLVLFLGRNCLSVSACTAGNTCQDGTCVPKTEAGRRAAFDPKIVPRPPDAGASIDAPADTAAEAAGETAAADGSDSPRDQPTGERGDGPPDAAAESPADTPPESVGLGNGCSSGAECSSGHCIDGVCCNEACAAACAACNLGSSPGICSPHASGTDPENGCGLYTCDGMGVCYTSCAPAGGCPSACKANAYCTAAGCGPDLNNGQSCTSACQCATGVCGTFYQDRDGDTYGAGAAFQLCGSAPPPGYSASNTDCNDGDGAFNPGAREGVGDEIDQNCDGREVCYLDADNDGYRVTATIDSMDLDCNDAQEARATEPAGDCCDSDKFARPGQNLYFPPPPRDGCGGYDFNCDGVSTLRYPSKSMSTVACTGSPPCFATDGIGWVGTIPPCGAPPAQFRDCDQFDCTTITVSRNQLCR